MTIIIAVSNPGYRVYTIYGQANSSQFFNYIGKARHTHRHIAYSYCVKHNQHVKHTNTRGSGACSLENLGKTDALSLNLGHFRDLAS